MADDTLAKVKQFSDDNNLGLDFKAEKGVVRASITFDQYKAFKTHSMTEVTGSSAFSVDEERPNLLKQFGFGNGAKLAAKGMGANDFNAEVAAQTAISENSKHFLVAKNLSDKDFAALKDHLPLVKDGLAPDVAAMNRDLAAMNGSKSADSRTVVAGSSKTILAASPMANLDLTHVVGDLSFVQIGYNMKGVDNRGDFLPEMLIENNKMTLTFPQDQAMKLKNVMLAKDAAGKPVVSNEQLFGASSEIFNFNTNTGVLTVDKNTSQKEALAFHERLGALKYAALGNPNKPLDLPDPMMVKAMTDLIAPSDKTQVSSEKPTPGFAIPAKTSSLQVSAQK